MENQLESFFFFLLAAESVIRVSQPTVDSAIAKSVQRTRVFLAKYIELIFMIDTEELLPLGFFTTRRVSEGFCFWSLARSRVGL